MYVDDCVSVLPDLTLLPLLVVGRKSWYIIIIIIYIIHRERVDDFSFFEYLSPFLVFVFA